MPGRIQVRVYVDRLQVVSPGALPTGLTPADLYVPHGSRPWNPNIMACLFRRGIVEQLGSGTLRIIELCDRAGIGRPVFTATGGDVICSVPRQGYRLTPDEQSIELTGHQTTILETLAKAPSPRAELARLLNADAGTIRDVLTRLRNDGLIHVTGHERGARWHIGPTP